MQEGKVSQEGKPRSGDEEQRAGKRQAVTVSPGHG